MGESGSGKTTSMRNLNSAQTFYIDADKKGLSWRGWRKEYNAENKNFCATSDTAKIMQALNIINEKRPNIKCVVIDTLNGIMIDDEMKRAKEKGYDKWVDLASCVWNLIAYAHTLRDDLTVIFTAHTQTERDESGYVFTRIKTNGKKLDKIVLESKFNTVLLAKSVEGKYIFETHSKNSTAKTPKDAFESDEIENDIVKVLEVLEEY
jgi:hypothetical protein